MFYNKLIEWIKVNNSSTWGLLIDCRKEEQCNPLTEVMLHIFSSKVRQDIWRSENSIITSKQTGILYSLHIRIAGDPLYSVLTSIAKQINNPFVLYSPPRNYAYNAIFSQHCPGVLQPRRPSHKYHVAGVYLFIYVVKTSQLWWKVIRLE